jgi:hypothetical protein
VILDALLTLAVATWAVWLMRDPTLGIAVALAMWLLLRAFAAAEDEAA